MATTQAVPPKNLDQYKELIACVPTLEIKGATMPYTAVNGNMFSFLKEGSVGLHVPEKEPELFIKKFKSSLFETNCTVMKEYVTVSTALLKKISDLKLSVKASFEYAKTLKAKPKKQHN